MWFNGGGDMNTTMNLNPNMNSTMNSNMSMNNFMNMVPNFNANESDVFDFSLHSSSMQQGTESSSNAVPVSKIRKFHLTLKTKLLLFECFILNMENVTI